MKDMKRLYLLIIASGIIATACTPAVNPDMKVMDFNEKKAVACQKDLLVCPDGTQLVRIPPKCEFAACPIKKYQTIVSADIEGVDKIYKFQAQIPANWKIEAVPEIKSINIYDPSIKAENNLEKSQIFIRHFTANTFLTLRTVTIFDSQQMFINNRPTVVYDIAKKDSTANFPSQPSWRNARHSVTDIRETDSNPSTFYVFGRNPKLSEDIWNHFIQSVKFEKEEAKSYPQENITLKPFGIYITPKNSPVTPERFTGYHTGVDFEYNTPEEVEIFSLADGEVIYAGRVNGYGGVVAIKQNISSKDYVVVYGHLDPKSLVFNGSKVKKDEVIGVLGDAFSDETDGERRHLHLSLYKGDKLDLRGYAATEEILLEWDDPAEVLFN